MKTAVSFATTASLDVLDREAGPSAEAGSAALVEVRRRLSAYVTLTKPRITLMVLITMATGYVLGARGATHPSSLLLALLGTGLVASSASALNQLFERARDRLMRRTSRRPLPTGAVRPIEAAALGLVLGAAGVGVLAVGANGLTAVVALATLLLYVGVYTPLKSRTTLNTAIGAIPGALPPVIGWAAATGRLGVEAWALFLIVFLWQFPHFLAIAWIYRDDYARGGHRMLPSIDPTGTITARQSTVYALALVPAALLPTVVGLAGPFYFAGALLLSLAYLACSVRFWLDVSDHTARRLLRASFLYLPLILALLLLNPLPA